MRPRGKTAGGPRRVMLLGMLAGMLQLPACTFDHESDPAAYDRIAYDRDTPLRYDQNRRWVPVPLFSLYPRSGMLYIGDEDHGRRLAAERAAREERARRATPESRPADGR